MRIASFLPSATEALFAIGAGDQVCAVTFECDYPPEARSKPQVVFSHLPPGLAPAEIDAIVSAEGVQGSSLYFVEYDRLESLAPTLVVLQDLCRVCAIDSPTLARDMSRLSSAPQVISLAAHSIPDILREIELLGEATGHAQQAHALTQGLRQRVDRVREARSAIQRRKRVLCLEWLDPPFLGGHWVPEMALIAGGDPVLSSPTIKSVRTTWQQIAATQPEIIVLMPCGFNLAQTIDQFRALTLPPEWETLPAVREGEVYAVNGSAYFSRHGPRFIDGLEILDAILNPSGEPDSRDRFAHLPAESVQRL
ncbi:ABC transporter substrate-binding protein [Granulicella sp. 5B5]|uniref:cobalamin-binding protein n=1 Tax=Granulicella sp. 5B5 TaxID=1617967 RepID=UPI0015F3772B|nr:cobalamin-binding protein [Granulicella sp. 5B5]QMV18704.1 ABC transporter substrate-binding protein [Granulicella sp. 5B5]